MNKKTENFRALLLGIVFFLSFGFIISCSDDEEGEVIPEDPDTEEPDLSTFAGVIAQGNEIEPFQQTRQTDTVAVADPVNEDEEVEAEDGSIATQRFVCTKKTVNLSDGTGRFQLFDTNADIVYPGSLLQGKTLSEATPSPIVVKRAGGTISFDLNNGNLQSTFTVDEVKKSTIQDAMNNIIASSGDVVPANFQLDIINVESESQLAVELGVDVKVFRARVSADMSFSREKKFNRTLVKLNQKYFTMSFDLPTSVDEIFDESVTPEQLNTFVQPDNPATFISSVTFGRKFFMLIESTSSRQEIQTSLNTAFKGFGVKVKAELDVNSFKSLKDLKIKVIAYGGDAKGTFELAGETSIEAIANQIAQSTDIKAGLPLSYVVRSVERPDQIVGTTLATEYDVVDCELKGTLPKAGYRGLVDIFEDGIGAATQIKLSTIAVYNKAGDQYALYNVSSAEVMGKFDVNDPDGPLSVPAFDNVGAAVKVANNLIYVFNEDGLKMQIFDFDQDVFDENALPDAPIGTYREDVLLVNQFFAKINEFPFLGDGINAGIRFLKDGQDGARRPVPNSMLFSSNGREFMQAIKSGDDFNNFGIRKNDKLPGESGPLFDRVGAGARVVFSGTTAQLLFINGAGDQMMYWEGDVNVRPRTNFDITSTNVSGKFTGPFVLK